jgi:hypothetical protein
MKEQRTQKASEVNGTHQLLVYADDDDMVGENTNAIRKRHRGSVRG